MSNSQIIKKLIDEVSVNSLFGVLSKAYGYDYSEWIDDIIKLQEKWANQGYIEIYQTLEDREWGRVKDSSLAQGASPYYIGLFHARLLSIMGNDPLVIVKFHETESGQIADMKLMLDHDEIFGDKNQKYSPEELRQLRKELNDLIIKADIQLSTRNQEE